MIITQFPDNSNHNPNPHRDDPVKFFGFKVCPNEYKTVTFRRGIRLTQASLGKLCSDERRGRYNLLCKYDGDEIIVASLRLKHKEMRSLKLPYDGPGSITFLVNGSREIHLIGYSFDNDKPAISTEIFGGNGQSSSTKDETFKGNSSLVTKLNAASLAPPPNIPILVHVHGMTPSGQKKVTMDEKFDILLQGVTRSQFEAFGKSMDDKLRGTNPVRRKLDYLLENEAKEKVEDASHGTTAEVVVCSEDSEVDKDRVERQGSPEYHVVQSKIRERRSKRKNDYDGQADLIRSTADESLQTVGIDACEAKRLKKLKKRKNQRQAKADDSWVVNDGQQATLCDLEESENLPEHIVEDKSLSFGCHNSEDDAVGTKISKRRKKSKKVEVAEEEVTNSSGCHYSEDDAVGTKKSKRRKKSKKAKVTKEEVNNRVVNDVQACDLGEGEKLQEEIAEDKSLGSGCVPLEDHPVDKTKERPKSKKREIAKGETTKRSEEVGDEHAVLALCCPRKH